MSRQSVIYSILFLLILLPVASQSQLYFTDELKDAQFTADLLRLEETGNREEGSEEEKQAIIYIKERLKNLGIQTREYKYDLFSDTHSFSKGIEAYFPGSHPDTFIIVCSLTPLSNPGNFDIALALSLAEMIKQNEIKQTIRILFLGGEKGSSYPYPIGSRTFLEQYPESGETVVMYLDTGKAPLSPKLNFGGYGDNAPEWLFRSLYNSFKDSEIPLSIRGTDFQIYRIKAAEKYPPSAFYMENGLPAFCLENSESGEEISQPAEKINSAVMDFLQSYKSGFPSEWDRNYLVVTLNKRLTLIKEKYYIIFFSIVLSLFLMLLIFQKRKISFNFKRFKSYIWTLPLIICLTYIFLFLATMYLQEIFALKGQSELWKKIPTLSFIFKISASLLLYNLFLQFIRELPLARSPHFYSYSAFIMVVINLVLTSLINISLSFYFIWFLFFLILFIATKSLVIRWITAIIMPVFLVISLSLVLFTPYPDVCRILLVSRINGNWIFTSLLTPYILVLTSLNYHSHHYKQRRKNWLFIFQTLLWFLLAGAAFAAIFIYSPYNEERKQNVLIRENIDINRNTRILEISSEAAIKDLHIEMNGKNYYLQDLPSESRLQGSINENFLEIQKEYKLFLGRKVLNLGIDAAGDPEQINVEFLSASPLSIYSCNYPYSQTPDRNRSTIHVGKNPPDPLMIELVFTEESSPQIKINILYSKLPHALPADGKNLNIEKTMSISSQINLEDSDTIKSSESRFQN